MSARVSWLKTKHLCTQLKVVSRFSICLSSYLIVSLASCMSICVMAGQSISTSVRPSSSLNDCLFRLFFRLSVVRVLRLYCYEYGNCNYLLVMTLTRNLKFQIN